MRQTLPILLVLAVCLPAWAGTAEDADRAWGSGDHATALELYDRVLEEQPENFRALLRSAKLLSWQNRFGKSIVRYDRAIDVDPGDREALLGRAVTLSWAGRYSDARAGFQVLLEEDEADIDALLGLARTFAWTNRSSAARIEYERVLDHDPENVDARVGLAYLDLWGGEIGSAARQARNLKDEYPEHVVIAKLHTHVSRSAGAWWALTASDLDDTDHNRLKSYRVSGGLGLGHQTRLDLAAERYDMSNPSGDASIDNVNVTASYHPQRGQRFSATVGYDRRTRTDNTTDGDVLGGLSCSWGLERRWQIHASGLRLPVRYSPEITDNGITFDQFQVRTTGAVGERFRVHASFASADSSDDNGRVTGDAGFMYRLPLRKVRMQVGYTARGMDYDKDLANGYFDPQNFLAHLAQIRVHDEYGKRENYYRLYLDAGVQSFTIAGVDVNDDTVLVLGGTFGFPLTPRLTLEAFGEHGDYAATNAAGFESTTAGLRLRWRAGL